MKNANDLSAKIEAIYDRFCRVSGMTGTGIVDRLNALPVGFLRDVRDGRISRSEVLTIAQGIEMRRQAACGGAA